MTISGSYNYTSTRNEIILRSLRLVGALSEGLSATTQQINDAAEALNSLVKQLQTEGIRLWSYNWYTQALTASSSVTGTDAEKYRCIRSHTSANANKPITGADYSTYWVKDSTTAGGVWATPTAYTSISEFTMPTGCIGLDRAFLRDVSSTGGNQSYADYDLAIVNFRDYFDEWNKNIKGRPELIAYDEQLSGRIYVYPEPDDTTDVIHFRGVQLLSDFDAAGNTPDFPVRWNETLTFGLAYKLSFEYGLPGGERQQLEREYEKLKYAAKANDKPKVTNYFVRGAY